MRWRHYLMMRSLEETLEHLAENRGLARVVAGGTDLLVQIRAMEAREDHLTLLDVSGVAGLRGIHEADGHLLIGAATTMAELTASPLVRQKARSLAHGSSVVRLDARRLKKTLASALELGQW